MQAKICSSALPLPRKTEILPRQNADGVTLFGETAEWQEAAGEWLSDTYRLFADAQNNSLKVATLLA